jgi:hypothetical protein
MRPNMTQLVTSALFMPVILLAGGTVPTVAQGVPTNPPATQAVPANPSPAIARPGSQPAAASVARGPTHSWVGYRSVQPGTSQAGTSRPGTKTSQPPSGWKGYTPATGWLGYPSGVRSSPATGRPGAATGHPVNKMDRSRVTGPSPYHGNQPRSYHEYGSGRRVSLAKPWLPGSP